MCVICGCDTHAGPANRHEHEHGHETYPHIAPDPVSGALHYGAGTVRSAEGPSMSPTRAVQLEADLLGANNRYAAHNRRHFAAHGVAAYNLVSSPGSGKTTLLCATIEALKRRAPGWPVAVIEGDQQTSLDADRIRATGAPAIQVNTGRGCHLDAQMVGTAFEHLDLRADHATSMPRTPVFALGAARRADHATSMPRTPVFALGAARRAYAHHPALPAPHADRAQALLFIENVGNLVCPALWDLGEAAKVVILSVTEGEDKPLKYPDMFAAASLMLINKLDLLPHVDFDVAKCIAYARRVNPGIEVLQLSATRGDGMNSWIDWLRAG